MRLSELLAIDNADRFGPDHTTRAIFLSKVKTWRSNTAGLEPLEMQESCGKAGYSRAPPKARGTGRGTG
jgi:hypothetical protein